MDVGMGMHRPCKCIHIQGVLLLARGSAAAAFSQALAQQTPAAGWETGARMKFSRRDHGRSTFTEPTNAAGSAAAFLVA